jgi:ABC-type Fe3+/spermidine/putrescine transport system ATPase subunit
VGSPEDVYLRPRSPFVAGFLGAVNWIGGTGVRPESTRIAIAGKGAAGGAPGIPGTVTGSIFLGDCVQVLVRLASGENAVAQIPRSQAVFQPGDAVQLGWDAADGMAFS